MLFTHPDRPGLGVRLSYGLNLFPSRDAAGVLAGLREFAVPLKARVAPQDRAFGVGAWIPDRAAREFLGDGRSLDELWQLCEEHGLELATWNAFPQGDFHGPGLKERVFEPTWKDLARLGYTLRVAVIAAHARARRGGAGSARHVSISTHAGMWAPAMRPGDREDLISGFLAAARELARFEAESGERIVLALEPEPRSTANDTRELSALLRDVRWSATGPEESAVWRHLGACLDTCHAAVEFEAPDEAFERATAQGTVLGKIQFSSALRLDAPDRDPERRARFLALDEPVYLHQVTARRGSELLRVHDLPEVAREADAWRGASEWRCHFHVPVDLADYGAGFGTTRAEAEAVLAAALAAPERWGSCELHVEVETYTWNLLRPADTGVADVLDGLEHELAHVRGLLWAAGWRLAG